MRKIFLWAVAAMIFAFSANAQIVNNSGTGYADSIGLPFFVLDSSGNMTNLTDGDSVFIFIWSPGGSKVFRDTVAYNDALLDTAKISLTGTRVITFYNYHGYVAALDGTTGRDGWYNYAIMCERDTGQVMATPFTGGFQLYQTRDFNAFADFIDAAITSRMATYTQPTGFLAATFPTGTIANTTNITAGTITTATNLTTNNDKTGYTLSTAGIDAIWEYDTNLVATATSLGRAVKNTIDTTKAVLAEVLNIDAWNPITDNDSLIIDASDGGPKFGLAGWNTSALTAFTAGSMGDSAIGAGSPWSGTSAGSDASPSGWDAADSNIVRKMQARIAWGDSTIVTSTLNQREVDIQAISDNTAADLNLLEAFDGDTTSAGHIQVADTTRELVETITVTTDTGAVMKAMTAHFDLPPQRRNVRFVDDDGSNADGLTLATAWTSPNSINANVGSNTQVYIMDGNYAAVRCSLENVINVSILGESMFGTRVLGDSTNDVFTLDSCINCELGYMTVEGKTQSMAELDPNPWANPITIYPKSDRVRIHDIFIDSNNYKGIVTVDTLIGGGSARVGFVEIDHCLIHNPQLFGMDVNGNVLLLHDNIIAGVRGTAAQAGIQIFQGTKKAYIWHNLIDSVASGIILAGDSSTFLFDNRYGNLVGDTNYIWSAVNVNWGRRTAYEPQLEPSDWWIPNGTELLYNRSFEIGKVNMSQPAFWNVFHKTGTGDEKRIVSTVVKKGRQAWWANPGADGDTIAIWQDTMQFDVARYEAKGWWYGSNADSGIIVAFDRFGGATADKDSTVIKAPNATAQWRPFSVIFNSTDTGRGLVRFIIPKIGNRYLDELSVQRIELAAGLDASPSGWDAVDSSIARDVIWKADTAAIAGAAAIGTIIKEAKARAQSTLDSLQSQDDWILHRNDTTGTGANYKQINSIVANTITAASINAAAITAAKFAAAAIDSNALALNFLYKFWAYNDSTAADLENQLTKWLKNNLAGAGGGGGNPTGGYIDSVRHGTGAAAFNYFATDTSGTDISIEGALVRAFNKAGSIVARGETGGTGKARLNFNPNDTIIFQVYGPLAYIWTPNDTVFGIVNNASDTNKGYDYVPTAPTLGKSATVSLFVRNASNLPMANVKVEAYLAKTNIIDSSGSPVGNLLQTDTTDVNGLVEFTCTWSSYLIPNSDWIFKVYTPSAVPFSRMIPIPRQTTYIADFRL